jgi:cysteinyl-tRNA synthetase
MTMRFYNTLTSQKEDFEPAEPGHAKVYVCGPTVYDYAHLGHIRSAVVYDVLVRHLRKSGLTVSFVRNITDIDDKIINRSKESGEEPTALAERFAQAYAQDMAAVRNLVPDTEPRVSTHLEQIHALIGRLIDKGAAYESGGDVYFDVSAFPGYGKLSHRKLSELALGASGRTSDAEASRKRHPADFALWKKAPAGEPAWPSPWSEGRPGWHIECSAMSMHHLGESFDLHGGGLDLVFPHHENEIAQSEAATGKPFVKMWIHNGFIEVNKEKMSKSLGNFFTARELFKRVEPEAVRYFMLTHHYRGPLHLEWTVDDGGAVTGFPQFEEAERRVEYIYSTRERLSMIPEKRVVDRPDPVPQAIEGFVGALAQGLDDDLNMPLGLSHLSEFLKAVNELAEGAKGKKGKVAKSAVEAARKGFAALDAELGLGGQDPEKVLLSIRDRRAADRGITGADVETKISARAQARADKDFEKADAIRAELTAMGVELLDSPAGTTWRIR